MPVPGHRRFGMSDAASGRQPLIHASDRCPAAVTWMPLRAKTETVMDASGFDPEQKGRSSVMDLAKHRPPETVTDRVCGRSGIMALLPDCRLPAGGGNEDWFSWLQPRVMHKVCVMHAPSDAPSIPAGRWHGRLATPILGGGASEASEARFVRFRGIDGRINQPALLGTVLSIHPGGRKRATRLQDRHSQVRDVDEGFIAIDLVAVTGRGRSQFFRTFRRFIGPAPRAFLTDLRVQHAAVGLDPVQRARAFRPHLGVPPTGSRRQHGRAVDEQAVSSQMSRAL